MVSKALKCSKCGSLEILLSRLRYREKICLSCYNTRQQQWRDRNREHYTQQNRLREARRDPTRRSNWKRAYNAGLGGALTKLRARGLSEEHAQHWAPILLDDTTRCDICGIPRYVLAKYQKDGPWPRFMGKRTNGRRLHLDHITPGVNDGNYRALCPACNSKRGDAVYTDEEVLAWIRSRWEFILPLRFLWWLNKTPGVGGRLWRSDRISQKYARFVAAHAPALSEGKSDLATLSDSLPASDVPKS